MEYVELGDEECGSMHRVTRREKKEGVQVDDGLGRTHAASPTPHTIR